MRRPAPRRGGLRCRLRSEPLSSGWGPRRPCWRGAAEGRNPERARRARPLRAGDLPAPGAHSADGGDATVGGTMTFTDVGAAGWWPRRLDRDPSDSACTVKSGTDTWGGAFCLTEHDTTSPRLAPFDEEMTLLLKAVKIRQLAVYQPTSATSDGAWSLVSSWDDRDGASHNLWATQAGNGGTTFPGGLHARCLRLVRDADAGVRLRRRPRLLLPQRPRHQTPRMVGVEAHRPARVDVVRRRGRQGVRRQRRRVAGPVDRVRLFGAHARRRPQVERPLQLLLEDRNGGRRLRRNQLVRGCYGQ